MPQTLLGSLALAYQPLWGRSRELVGIRLAMLPVSGGIVDAPHLLQVLRSFWPHRNASLILSPSTPDLLCTLLEKAYDYSPCIEVQSDWLVDADITALVQLARGRGLRLVWRGPNEDAPPPELIPCFTQSLLRMDEQDTLSALRSALFVPPPYGGANDTAPPTPVQRGQIYEGIANRALTDHCLDKAGAAALMGWPADEMLHPYQYAPVQPDRSCLQRVINAASADASMESIEHLLAEDPVLAYRFMTHINSAALGLRGGIDSLRRGLMMMGYTALAAWCVQQVPHANEDRNLNPVRTAMVLRASLTEHLLDAGGEVDLRREIYMCGLFSQLDLLLGGSSQDILARIPVSDRITEAVTANDGPYAPYLCVARAMESASAGAVQALCDSFEMNLDDVNRAFLRTLGATPVNTAA